MNNTRSLHRSETPEHPFVIQAKQYAREAGSSQDNTLINWGLKLIEDALAFGNKRK